jgi:hypothetical protein
MQKQHKITNIHTVDKVIPVRFSIENGFLELISSVKNSMFALLNSSPPVFNQNGKLGAITFQG